MKRCQSVIKNMSKRQRAIQYACALSASLTIIPELHFAVYGRQLPLKQTLCHDKVV